MERGALLDWVAAGLLALAAGCVAEGPGASAGPVRGAVVGGVDEAGYAVTGALVADHGGGVGAVFCSSMAITPTVVVSAAHCLDQFDDTTDPIVFLLRASSGGTAYRTLPETRRRHPSWPDYQYDIGLFALRSPLPETMYPELRRAPVGGADVGADLVVVGYGETSPGAGDAGVKRSVAMQVASAAGPYFVIRHPDGWRGVCHGDSGGPSLRVSGVRETLWGVHARTQDLDNCGPGEDTSVGDLFASFVEATALELDPTARSCGDGVCTGLESASECPADCVGAACGDGATDPGEACDDGNHDDGDGCSADCGSDESCGNGVLDTAAGEVCDDGNTASGDGCSGDCTAHEGCGDGSFDPALGEVCDDGNMVDGDGCSADCGSDESCGNGVVDGAVGEVCDDGGFEPGDGCSPDCLSDESCGNGVLDATAGEVCDDGNTQDGDGCSADCSVAEGCGNGVLERELGEVCDDGNTEGGDGCAAGCRSNEECGNFILDPGEACDDGNLWDDDGCPADCGPEEEPSAPGASGDCGCRAAAPSRPTSVLRALVLAF